MIAAFPLITLAQQAFQLITAPTLETNTAVFFGTDREQHVVLERADADSISSERALSRNVRAGWMIACCSMPDSRIEKGPLKVAAFFKVPFFGGDVS